MAYEYDHDCPFEAFITNLGKYNEGELVGEWVKFPTTSEELQGTAIGEGIETEQSLHHRVGAVGIHLDAASLNVGRKLDVDEVVTVVLHAVDMGDGQAEAT